MTRRFTLLAALVALVATLPASAQDVPPGAVFVASSRGTVYYWVGCTNWQTLNVANRRFFGTRQEAVDAGYRLSSVAACAGAVEDGPSTTRPLVSHIVDVGPGLCTVTVVPGPDRNHFIVYDAGHWTGQRCISRVREVVGANPIDLMVISHSDSDHVGDADLILEQFVVESVITTGFVRGTASWEDMRDALVAEESAGAEVQRLTDDPLTPGDTLSIGDAVVTMVAGWPRWDLTRGLSSAERRNVVSIVIRIDYAGSSILYAGDTVGKRLTDDDSACKDAEMVMVGRHEASVVSLDSDVMIAAHHGGNNGNAACFIEAVSPSAVVFSAGHGHEHPTLHSARRFLAAGVHPDSLFRTDRGDSEAGDDHWEPAGSVSPCGDSRGDDDVLITIEATGAVSVAYAQAPGSCQ